MHEEIKLLKEQLTQLKRENTLLKDQHKEKDKAFNHLKNHYKSLVDNSLASINILDKNGTYLVVNKKAANIMGGTVDSIVGKNMFDLLSQEDAEFYYQRNKKFIENKFSETYEREFIFDSSKRKGRGK
jgi:PAS domain S-box-containing protein